MVVRGIDVSRTAVSSPEGDQGGEGAIGCKYVVMMRITDALTCCELSLKEELGLKKAI